MRVFSDPTRLAIYERIVADGETTIGALTREAGVSQPAVSQHVRVLLDARLVDGRREGRHMYYRAEPRGLDPLTSWLRRQEERWAKRLDRLDEHLETMKRTE